MMFRFHMPARLVSRRRLAAALMFASAAAAIAACNRDLATTPVRDMRGAGSAHDLAPVNPDSIGLAFVCETRFRVRNRNDAPADLRWVLVGTTDTNAVTASGRASGAAFADTYFETAAPGTVRLFYGATRIAAATADTTSCPTYHLVTRSGAGVAALTPDDTLIAKGSLARYAFTAAQGYTNIRVLYDDSLLSAPSGYIRMTKNHIIRAYADLDVALPPSGDPLVVQLRAVLTAADAVGAYQGLLDTFGSLFDTVGPDAASDRITRAELAAYHYPDDSAALRRVDHALALHDFDLGVGRYDGSGASDGTVGGGVVTNRRPSTGGLGNRIAVPGRASRELFPVTEGPCAPVVQPAVAGSPEPTLILYVNGMYTDPAQAALSATKIRCAVSRAGQLSNSNYTIKHFYNREYAQQFSEDLRASIVCQLAQIPGGGVNSFATQAMAAAGCAGRAVLTFFSAGDRLEVVRQFAQVHYRLPGTVEDADSLSHFIAGRRRDFGEHVIVIAHSQGNMMTQQAVQSLRDSGLYKPASDSLCIGAVSIAAPTSSNWPIKAPYLVAFSSPNDYVYVNVGHNSFPLIPTTLSDSAESEVAKVLADAQATPDSRLRRIRQNDAAAMLDVYQHQIHGINENYLAHAPTRDAMTDGVAQIHRECTVGQLTIDPAQSTIQVQQSQTLTAKARNRNGHDMKVARTVAWTPSRRITGTIPGTINVRAKVFDRGAMANVQVLPATLVVTATQQFNSVWNQGETNMGDPWPDPGAPPQWDGGQDSCNQTKVITGGQKTPQEVEVWMWYEHCFYTATGTVTPLAGLKIVRYRWRWYDEFDRLIDGPTNRLTTYDAPVRSLDTPGTFRLARLTVEGLNANGDVLARGEACLWNCE